MEWSKQTIKNLLLVICGGAAFYVALQNLGAVIAALKWILGVLSPFFAGGHHCFYLECAHAGC